MDGLDCPRHSWGWRMAICNQWSHFESPERLGDWAPQLVDFFQLKKGAVGKMKFGLKAQNGSLFFAWFEHIVWIWSENSAMFQVIFGGIFFWESCSLQIVRLMKTRPGLYFPPLSMHRFFVRLKWGSSFNALEFRGWFKPVGLVIWEPMRVLRWSHQVSLSAAPALNFRIKSTSWWSTATISNLIAAVPSPKVGDSVIALQRVDTEQQPLLVQHPKGSRFFSGFGAKMFWYDLTSIGHPTGFLSFEWLFGNDCQFQVFLDGFARMNHIDI